MKEYIKIRQIIDEINKKNKFQLIGGAGSGKTTTLIELIDYLIKLNKKILVISFTNVAKDEIIERYGENQNLKVSTIHSFIREFMRQNRKLFDDFLRKNYYNFLSKDVKEKYKWDEFEYKGFGFFGEVNFEEQFETGKLYVSNYYVPKIFGTALLNDKRILETINGMYDVIFIDEFQDTDQLLVEGLIQEKLDKTSIGFFGDPKQRIYEKPMEIKLEDKIITFNKVGNYRSSTKVVNFINELRNDFKQESLNKDVRDYKTNLVLIQNAINSNEYLKIVEDMYGIKFDAILHLKNDQRLLHINNKAFDCFKAFNPKDGGINRVEFVKGNSTHSKLVFKILQYFDDDFKGKDDFWIIQEDEKTKEKIILKGDERIKISRELDRIFERIKNINSLSDVRKIVKQIMENMEITKEMDFFISYDLIEEINNPLFDCIDWTIYLQAYDLWKGKYHNYTLHSTKGKEYDNVAVYLDNGGWASYNLIKYFNDEIFNGETREKTEMLLYVAFSRARKNLFILTNEIIEGNKLFKEHFELIKNKLN